VLVVLKELVFYSMDIASDGHSSMQVSHSTQRSGSTFAFPSTMVMAAEGQTSTQVSQAVHFSVSTTAGKLSSSKCTYFLRCHPK